MTRDYIEANEAADSLERYATLRFVVNYCRPFDSGSDPEFEEEKRARHKLD